MSDAFLNEVNSTEKKLGHNMLQVEIAALQKEVEYWKTSDNEKEMKLGLFKKTISNLQSQLQDRALKITDLESKIRSQTTFDSKTILESNNSIESLNLEKTEIQKQIELLQQQQTNDANTITSLKKQNLDLQSTLENTQSAIHNVKLSFDKQTKENETSKQLNASLQQQLDMKTNISDNLAKELETLKITMASFQSQNETLKCSLEETIQQLREQLEHQQANDTPAPKLPQVAGFPRSTRDRRKR